eukprot:TRINITY_DN2630_c5_g2_i5.p2 TRINITY_DN2630_c5_g2~~TRINITY_DN2630_c5_g2_i5.p2  ORF type:complete len:310 (+),score=104.94 TRINITY_DN2630_c5_g2_i5:112-930(+)
MPAVSCLRQSSSFRCSAPARRPFSATACSLARGRPGTHDSTDVSPAQQQHQEVMGRQSEYDSLTPEIRQYMVKVYNVMGSGVVTAGVGAGAMLLTPLALSVNPMMFSLGAFIPLLWLSFRPPASFAGRLSLFHATTGMIGAGLAPVVAKAVTGGVLGSALVLTAAIFGGFSTAALLAPRGAALSMMGPLMAGLLGMILLQLISAFVYPIPFMSQITLLGGLALFSLLIAADTGAMIERARQGAQDPVQDGLSMFLNIVNVFVRIVEMLTGRD